MRTFDTLEHRILGPLEGQPDEVWHASPRGKWSPGEVVSHLAMALHNSAHAFVSRADHAPMQRRPLTVRQRVARLLIMGLNWFPPGAKAPPGALPDARPDRPATERKLREAIEEFRRLERTLLPTRKDDLFVKHPAFGDLTLPEWMSFHERHCEHHARQIRQRVAMATTLR